MDCKFGLEGKNDEFRVTLTLGPGNNDDEESGTRNDFKNSGGIFGGSGGGINWRGGGKLGRSTDSDGIYSGLCNPIMVLRSLCVDNDEDEDDETGLCRSPLN